MQVQRAVWQSSEHASLWLMVTLRRICFEYQSVLRGPPRSRPVYHMALWGSQMSNAPGEGTDRNHGRGKIDDRLQVVRLHQHCMPLRFFGSFRCLFLTSNSCVFRWWEPETKSVMAERRKRSFRRKVHNSAFCNVCKIIISSKGGKAVKQYPHTLFYAPWVFLGETRAYVKKVV